MKSVILGVSLLALTACGEKVTRTEPEGANPGECTDGADNDFDGDYDCNDSDCAGSPDCLESDCADGADNDSDGLFDCDDPDCAENTTCVDDFEGDEAVECTDGADNDGDGDFDCDDDGCADRAECQDITDTSDSGEIDTYTGSPIYAGRFQDAPGNWGTLSVADGFIGFEAGNTACKSIGADHVCAYTEVLAAQSQGDFSSISQGTTAWLHRTTYEMVNGVDSPPGAGGRCNDWTADTSHVADGEYVSFDQAGVPTFHLDDDTFYDGVSTAHVQPDLLPCGGVIRDILCCH